MGVFIFVGCGVAVTIMIIGVKVGTDVSVVVGVTLGVTVVVPVVATTALMITETCSPKNWPESSAMRQYPV